jgi:hopene-associated glycosyltransferase HpnB
MTAAALLALAAWIYLLFGHGGFWRTDQTDEGPAPSPSAWPAVAAIVPARNEAAVIGGAVTSLLAQDYPGPFRLVVVDDGSADGTAAVAQAAASGEPRLEILRGAPLAPGWTGKLWALEQGRARVGDEAEWLWLTDADIVHAPDTLGSLVARGEADGLVLNSLMARLECERPAERALIPAFIFFFAMLYPFARVNRPGPTAAAAGGCLLVRRTALARAGGLAVISRALIDDCAMGRTLKAQGPIRLALTRRSRSTRPYAGWEGIAAMVARSAYAQLGYSPLLLAGTVAGMALLYLAPPVAAVAGHGLARGAGLAAWGAMAFAFQPILRFYGRAPWWGVALPLIALFYTGCTVRSALAYYQGRGGEWKGRAQAVRS